MEIGQTALSKLNQQTEQRSIISEIRPMRYLFPVIGVFFWVFSLHFPCKRCRLRLFDRTFHAAHVRGQYLLDEHTLGFAVFINTKQRSSALYLSMRAQGRAAPTRVAMALNKSIDCGW